MTRPGPLTFHYDGHWRDNAACRGKPTRLFFTELGEPLDEARAICATCPVINRCLEEGVINNEIGVWGGTSDRERRLIRRRWQLEGRMPARTRPRPACSTEAGHRWHLRNNETPCIGCLDAHAQAKRLQDPRLEPSWRIQCGQNAGYQAHVRAGERPCQPCLTAHALYQARNKKYPA